MMRTYGTIVVEDLKVGNMMKSAKGTNVAAKRGLNKSIQNAGWGRLRELLQYKCVLNGSTLIEVDPRNTSRMCRECGHVAAENRRSERFRRVSCGHQAHADVNAALNILHRGGVVPEPHNVGRRTGRVAGKAAMVSSGPIPGKPQRNEPDRCSVNSSRSLPPARESAGHARRRDRLVETRRIVGTDPRVQFHGNPIEGRAINSGEAPSSRTTRANPLPPAPRYGK